MKLQSLLSQPGLVLQSPSAEEITTRAGASSPTKLFYGETYDSSGNPIDSMKYYFFVSDLARSLNQEGFRATPTILVADTAACRNVSSELERKYMALGSARADFIRQINQIYGTGLEVVKMSEYIDSPEFQREFQRVRSVCTQDPDLMRRVERTVPESKIEEERAKGFAYSFDEITTIMDLDVKVGPPREDLYDNIAREIASRAGKKGLMSLFLTPTFPLGLGWDYFFANEGIEDHGITAYKAGSKRLQDHRIIVGRTNIEYAKELIDKSFIPRHASLPNPVLDIAIISEMAGKRLRGDDFPSTLEEEFRSGSLSPDQLRTLAAQTLDKNILSQF